MKLAIITLTENAFEIAKTCCDTFKGDLIHKPKPFKEKVQEAFHNYDVLLFVMATGIVVRTIGPICDHKSKDPCVIVMDEKARNVISLLSGHLGSGNEWTLKIASLYNSNPVITTASDVNNLLSVDMLAKKYNLILKDYDQAKEITQLLIHDKKIQVIGSNIIKESNYQNDEGEGILYIGHKEQSFSKPFVQLHPINLVLGIGCKKNTNPQALMNFVVGVLKENNYPIESIAFVASAWLKADEEAIIKLKNQLNIPFKVFSQSELLSVENLFEGSEFVKKITGVKSISLASGYLASNKGELLIDIIKKEGMTLSLWKRRGEPCYT